MVAAVLRPVMMPNGAATVMLVTAAISRVVMHAMAMILAVVVIQRGSPGIQAMISVESNAAHDLVIFEQKKKRCC